MSFLPSLCVRRFLFSLSPGPSVPSGWGEMPAVPAKAESSWGATSPPPALVDNGTAAWGKPPSSGSGWGDQPPEPTVTFARAGAPTAAPALCKPGEPGVEPALGGALEVGPRGLVRGILFMAF